jgi:7,8-dihydropterin-6-yl-methyl-4-(beta-D-ribofuranosyl)aminobenzene 5'-phosphate synthase
MRFRIHPAWWPVLALASPALVPWLAIQTGRFATGRTRALQVNKDRVSSALPLALPVLDDLRLTVLVDHAHETGFLGDAGVSYVMATPSGTTLMDVGFGPGTPSLAHNASRLGFQAAGIDSVVITHLHLDHMGGLRAARAHRVEWPEGFVPRPGTPCFLPAPADAPGLDATLVEGPRLLPGGLATTGPLARMLCLTGWIEEQALVAKRRDGGLVVVTGCGHPTLETILAMVRRMDPAKVHTVVGGLHFPITGSRIKRLGIQFQQVIGTGKCWWAGVTDADLTATIATLNAAGVQRLLLSAHDTCDHAIERLRRETHAEVEVVQAGASYIL